MYAARQQNRGGPSSSYSLASLTCYSAGIHQAAPGKNVSPDAQGAHVGHDRPHLSNLPKTSPGLGQHVAQNECGLQQQQWLQLEQRTMCLPAPIDLLSEDIGMLHSKEIDQKLAHLHDKQSACHAKRQCVAVVCNHRLNA